MAFPTKHLRVTLVDYHDNFTDMSTQLFLPMMVTKELQKKIGNDNEYQNVYLRMKDLPNCLSTFIFPNLSFQFNGFVLLYAVNNPDVFDGLNFYEDTELRRACKKLKAEKWKEFFEKSPSEDWMTNPANYNHQLLVVCSVILSLCVPESSFKRQMRLC
jgi:hypothetical protein